MTTVTFGRLLPVRSHVIIAKKGALAHSLLPYSLPASFLSPLALPKPPSFISAWIQDVNVIAVEYEHKASRCLGIVRADLVQDAANKHTPKEGDSQVILVVDTKEEALAAGK
jgi:hypothetical protein